MEKLRLLKVKGYYNEKDSFDFIEGKSWTGHAILREDLTFEGIVNDYCSQNEDRLISGTLVDYNGTSLMKFTNGGFCPCSFYGMSTGKTILGNWATHVHTSITEQGRCKILLTEVPAEEKLISDIECKMNSFKSEMDDYSKKLYDSLKFHISFNFSLFIENEDIEAKIGTPLKKLEL